MIALLTRYGLFIWVILFATLLIGCQEADPRLTELPQEIATVHFNIWGPNDMVIDIKTDTIYNLVGVTGVAILQGTRLITIVRTAGDNTVDIALDEEAGWVYIVNNYSDNVTVLKGTQVITYIPVADDNPTAVIVDPTTSWAYVLNVNYHRTPNLDSITGFDTDPEGFLTIIKGPNLIQHHSLGDFLPYHIAFEPNNSHMYVSEGSGRRIIVLNNLQEIARFTLNTTIENLEVNPQTGDVYALTGSSVYHYKEAQFVGKVDITGGGISASTMVVNPVNGYVYTIIGRKEVVVVENEQIIAKLPLQSTIHHMAVDPVNGNVYVANFKWNTLTLIQGTKVITTYKTGSYPYALAVNPVNGRVYISNNIGDSITILGYPGVEARLKEEAAQPSFISPVSPVR